MTNDNLIGEDSVPQGLADESGLFPAATCLACEALARDRTASAAVLHRIASRCQCGCVSPETAAELAAYAMADALVALADYARTTDDA
jgi:hypothetical protein